MKGIYGDIHFNKQGPAGKESGQNIPIVYLVQIKNGKVAEVCRSDRRSRWHGRPSAARVLAR